MARGNDRQKILLNQTDQAMIWGAPDLRQRYPLSLDSDVLMSNHFHLLFEVDRLPAVFRTGALL